MKAQNTLLPLNLFQLKFTILLRLFIQWMLLKVGPSISVGVGGDEGKKKLPGTLVIKIMIMMMMCGGGKKSFLTRHGLKPTSTTSSIP